jgi:hypothetical protein
MATPVVCCDVTFATVVAEYIAPIERVAPYEPGSRLKARAPVHRCRAGSERHP